MRIEALADADELGKRPLLAYAIAHKKEHINPEPLRPEPIG
jgi:hypothetical protein